MAEWAVNGYTGLRVLGSGGFGEVVLARHEATGTLVAVKYLRGELLADPEFAQMFRAEAAVLAAIDDLNVVRLYEYVETPSGAAIVMELVEGVSLRQILAHQGATTAEAALVVLQGSLLGLAAAHQRGVVHRDYKPENVLVGGAGESKLTDFGLAARAGDRPVPAGTVAYVAPEQIAGAPASPAGDVYAATATFYECLAGRPPFAGETQQILSQHQYAPVPLEAVPPPLRPLVAAGMAKDPAWRPADARTLVTALQAAAGPAYGPDWAARGRSHLGEAALLLAALWPSAAAPATQATTVQRISLIRRIGARVTPVKAVLAAGVIAAVATGGVVVANAVSGSGTVTVTVPAKAQGGVFTGIRLTVGKTYRISGTGSARYGSDYGGPCFGSPVTHPDGSRHLGNQNCGPKQDLSATLPTAPIGALIWRIGNGPWQRAPASFAAATAGPLYVAYNDDPGQYGNNSGSYTATITCGSGC